VDSSDRVRAARAVADVGRDVTFRFLSPRQLLVPAAEHRPKSGVAGSVSSDLILYSSPQLVSCQLMSGATNERRIFSVDCRHLLPHLATRGGDGSVVVQWCARTGGGLTGSAAHSGAANRRHREGASSLIAETHDRCESINRASS